jgi:UDP-N-acetylmuramyl pentapeptide phosphotransferase/UDP-N-acetylglucosamine-1-phosphate transferase
MPPVNTTHGLDGVVAGVVVSLFDTIATTASPASVAVTAATAELVEATVVSAQFEASTESTPVQRLICICPRLFELIVAVTVPALNAVVTKHVYTAIPLFAVEVWFCTSVQVFEPASVIVNVVTLRMCKVSTKKSPTAAVTLVTVQLEEDPLTDWYSPTYAIAMV